MERQAAGVQQVRTLQVESKAAATATCVPWQRAMACVEDALSIEGSVL